MRRHNKPKQPVEASLFEFCVRSDRSYYQREVRFCGKVILWRWAGTNHGGDDCEVAELLNCPTGAIHFGLLITSCDFI